MSRTLQLLPETFAVCRLASDAPLPEWAAAAGSFVSVTRTLCELSIVCAERQVPVDQQAEWGWRAFRVVGTLAFGMTGILASLATPLATAGISIFAVSTYDTDYVLIKDDRLADAVRALVAAGHRFSD